MPHSFSQKKKEEDYHHHLFKKKSIKISKNHASISKLGPFSRASFK